MKKVFSIFFITLLFLNCSAQKKPTPQMPILKPVPKPIQKTACGDLGIRYKKTDSWYNNKNKGVIKNYDFRYAKSIESVKNQYDIKKGIMFYKKTKIDSLQIFYRLNENTDYIVYVVKGKPIGYTINANNNPRPSMYSVSYNNDDISYNFIEQNIFLSKGNGFFKGYYYSEWNGKEQKFNKEIIKEEGEVKNNFKIGKWKYYNEEGKIDSTKTYTLKDSVDIRFPHCIFNKKEPCY